MKLLCDVHIPYRLVKFLNNRSITAIHVNRILAKWHTKDSEICRYADKHDYIVISKDTDFRNSHFLRHTPRKLIHVALGNIANSELIKIFDKNLELFRQQYKEDRCYIEISKEEITVNNNLMI